jgi:monoamine oxidase
MNTDRRKFLKTGAMAGISGSLLSSEILLGKSLANEPVKTQIKTTTNPKKVIVAGAGIAGLCCAYELMKLGHEVVVFDASGRHGGHVFTGRDGLSDGLYADMGAEHITKPGYERFWEYIEELDLEILPYPRRKNILRRIDGKFYTEEMLADSAVLKTFGFNQREIKYLTDNPWPELKGLYLGPYLDKFTDEYQPFGVGYDHMDSSPITELYQKEGASATALNFLGGSQVSGLYTLWQAAILSMRGVAFFPPEVFRLKGGNQGLPNAFAKKLGSRVRLNAPIVSIGNSTSGVTVTYKEFGEQKIESADYLANCIPPPAFRKIPVTPAFPAQKQYVLNNIAYGSYARFVFQASSKFWLEDGLSINMHLNHPSIDGISQVAEEVDTHRVALMGSAPAGVTPLRALAGFKEVYPGKQITIEHAIVKDWSKDQFAPTCERLSFPINTLKQFWPHVMSPHQRIHFAGASADNLNWGMEAATRSANRVAKEIDQA